MRVVGSTPLLIGHHKRSRRSDKKIQNDKRGPDETNEKKGKMKKKRATWLEKDLFSFLPLFVAPPSLFSTFLF